MRAVHLTYILLTVHRVCNSTTYVQAR